MRLQNIKAGIALVWVAIAIAAGSRLEIDTGSARALFAILAVLPPVAMWWLWNDPRPTMSESIDQARH
jgi:hypothetical protein